MFNLDGPDGFHYYWHDLQKEKLIFSKRVQGGGSVMIWGAFSSKGKSQLKFVDGTLTSLKYTSLLRTHLLPYGDHFHQDQYIFQHDNALCHRAKTTTEWLEERGIDFLDWPANSPDLNPIENLWGYLSRSVYANGRQYSNIDQLKHAIIDSWNKIPNEYIQKLILSMPDRLFEVAKASGSSIKY